jgi:hypothetical protein
MMLLSRKHPHPRSPRFVVFPPSRLVGVPGVVSLLSRRVER